VITQELGKALRLALPAHRQAVDLIGGMPSSTNVATACPRFIGSIKARVAAARLTAVRSVNRELISLYWDIGKAVVAEQERLGWGKSIVEQIARDLRAAFPGTRGFSARNVWDIRRLCEAYSQAEFLRQHVAELPSGHHLLILNKLDQPAPRLHCLRAITAFGWSRNVLLNRIKAGAYERSLAEGKRQTVKVALPERLAEPAEEALKSSYNMEFLGIGREIKERELEDRLIDKLRDFILELGYRFFFIGCQHRVTLGRNEYFIDLLFHHRFAEGAGGHRAQGRQVRAGVRQHNGFLVEPAEREGTRDRRCTFDRHHPVRRERQPRSRVRPEEQDQSNRCGRIPASFRAALCAAAKLPAAKQLEDAMRATLPRTAK
jgi:predicted nuclease of restriction endonuclease-like (RecB) superfamily